MPSAPHLESLMQPDVTCARLQDLAGVPRIKTELDRLSGTWKMSCQNVTRSVPLIVGLKVVAFVAVSVESKH